MEQLSCRPSMRKVQSNYGISVSMQVCCAACEVWRLEQAEAAVSALIIITPTALLKLELSHGVTVTVTVSQSQLSRITQQQRWFDRSFTLLSPSSESSHD